MDADLPVPGSLPGAVRARLLALLAGQLGRMPTEDVPPGLRAVARFTPVKRARLGAVALAAALESDPVLRQQAAQGLAASVADAVRQGSAPPAADPVELAAAAYLLRPSGWPSYVRAAVRELEQQAARLAGAAQVDAVQRLTDQLEQVRAAARAELQRAHAADKLLQGARLDVAALRRQLRAMGDRAGRAEAAQQSATSPSRRTAACRSRCSAAGCWAGSVGWPPGPQRRSPSCSTARTGCCRWPHPRRAASGCCSAGPGRPPMRCCGDWSGTSRPVAPWWSSRATGRSSTAYGARVPGRWPPLPWFTCSSVLSVGLPSVCRTAEGAVGEVEMAVLIDCDGCAVRYLACGDCVVTVLLDGPGGLLGVGGRHEVDDAEQLALAALAEGGLVPHLRLVPFGVPSASQDGSAAAAG